MSSIRRYTLACSLFVAASCLATGDTPRLVELFRGNPKFGLITGIHAVADRLFFFDSPPPAGSDGGDVYQFDIESGTAKRVFQVQEQGASVLRSFGGRLYIPGADAMEGWELGNFYVSDDKGETFKKVRTIPVGVHIWDITEWRGKLYVSTGSVRDGQGYGAVCESSDGGQTWTESLIAYPPDKGVKGQFGRCYALIPTADGLYASFMARDAQKIIPTPERDFYRYDGNTWSPATLLPERVATPIFGLRHREIGDAAFVLGRPNSYVRQGKHIQKLLGLESRSTFMVAPLGTDDLFAVCSAFDGKSSTLMKASLKGVLTGSSGFTKVLEMPAVEEAVTVESYRNRLFVGTKSDGGGRFYEVLVK
ncbi:MAG: exo-alpha-sialidase [Methanoregulaceae archaeon]|nr:exo-alpha-sialidase [Methanoregulaceae archaeon]